MSDEIVIAKLRGTRMVCDVIDGQLLTGKLLHGKDCDGAQILKALQACGFHVGRAPHLPNFTDEEYEAIIP